MMIGRYLLALLTLITTLSLAACLPGEADATPTLSVEQVRTETVATFAAGLTQTALAMPTSTPTETVVPTGTATETPAVTNTTVVPASPIILPTSTCNGLAFVADVTIPDNTKLNPGQKFTKTWKVRNNGTCAWDADFQLKFIGGEAMGGAAIKLEKSVGPGSEMELSVALTAPSTPGTYRGNWRMSTGSGAYFGDEVYLLVVVGGTPVVASSSTATNTSAPAATLTPSPTVSVTPTDTSVP